MRGPLLVALLAALPYLPSLGGGFLAYDDPYLVLTAWPIHQADLGAIVDPRSDRTLLGSEYLPVRDLTYLLDVRLNPRTPSGAPAPAAAFGFRVQNLLWYMLACALATALLRELLRSDDAATTTRTEAIAVVGGLLFALHPAHAESVAWIAGRKDVVSGALALGALLLHLRARRDDAPALHGGVALLALLACLAKSTATCLPFLIACVELLDPGPARGAPLRVRAARLAPTLLACGVVALIAIAVGRHTGVGRPLDLLGLPARLLLWDPPILRRYVVTAALPVRLRVHHHGLTALALDPRGSARLLQAGLSLAVLLPLAWVTVRATPRTRFCALWFVAALLPVANLVPFSQLVADRFLFLPLLGACLLVSLALARVYRRSPHLAAGLLGALVIVWGGLSVIRAREFGDDRRLWSANLRWEPGDPTALKHRGAAFARAGERAAARADLLGALEGFAASPVTNPTHQLEAQLELLRLYLEARELDPAIDLCLSLDPAPPHTARVQRAQLIVAARAVSTPDASIDALAGAVRLLRRTGRSDLATDALRRLRARDPLRASTLER